MATGTGAPAGTIALLFTDIEGSTRLASELGGAWPAVLADHHAIVGAAIAQEGGFVDGTEGDAFFATFADAQAASRAAIAALRDLRAHRWPAAVGGELKVRMGLHVGYVERAATGYVGLEVHRAARVAAAAHGGQLLLTGPARALLGDTVVSESLGVHRLKDFPSPEPLFCAVVDGRGAASFPPPRTQQLRPTNLPPLTRDLVGRARNLEMVSELLRRSRLVTISGIGGIGKTLLAIAVGRALLDDFPGGVFLVRLARVRDQGSVLPMVAEALGVSGDSDVPLRSVLGQRLAGQPTLIILDNFEQLVEGAPILSELLDESDELRLLVTSQVPLRVAAEQIVALAPLELDDAVSLFVDRARSADSSFAPTSDDLTAIQRICERLDNVPLAIELAAARVKLLGPAVLERRLERPLALLTRGGRDAPARQQSLRATIEWTYDLLDTGQQSMMATFGVCAGPIPLTAIEAIGGPSASPEQTLDRLDELLEFSLVRRVEDQRFGIRFLVVQALRDFALERLIALGHEQDVRRLHAEQIAKLAYDARLQKWGATDDQRKGLLAVAAEIRPAVAWARENDAELHVRMCAALASYWVYAGVIAEASEELQRARDSGAGSQADRAWILTLLAKCAQVRGRDEDAGHLADQVLTEWALVPDEHERALGLGPASWVLRWAARYEESAAASKQALDILRRDGNRLMTLRGLVFYAHSLADAQDVPGTEIVLREADELAGGDPVWELAAIHGDLAGFRGDHLAAVKLYAESLAWTSTTGESHQPLMDLRSLVTELVGIDRFVEALEVNELLRLEEERTGRFGNLPTAVQWGAEAVTVATSRVNPRDAARARQRAGEVPEARRAQRAIQIAADVAAAAPDLNAARAGAPGSQHRAERAGFEPAKEC